MNQKKKKKIRFLFKKKKSFLFFQFFFFLAVDRIGVTFLKSRAHFTQKILLLRMNQHQHV